MKRFWKYIWLILVFSVISIICGGGESDSTTPLFPANDKISEATTDIGSNALLDSRTQRQTTVGKDNQVLFIRSLKVPLTEIYNCFYKNYSPLQFSSIKLVLRLIKLGRLII